MNKTTILEALFETIEESMGWGLGSKDDKYSSFVNGAMDIARRLMDIIETVEDSPTTVDIGYGLGKDNASHTKIIDGESLAM